MDTRLSVIIDWLREVADAAQGLMVPVSGGSDGALCFWLCMQAFPTKTMAVHFGDNLLSSDWFERCGPVEYEPAPTGKSKENEIRRWSRMLELSQSNRRRIVGSRNRSEQVFGTYSRVSSLSTYLPLVALWKSEVLDLCEQIGVPSEITASSRKADPGCGREEEMAAISIEQIDMFLKVQVGLLPFEELRNLLEDDVVYLQRIFDRFRFKGSIPLIPPTPGF